MFNYRNLCVAVLLLALLGFSGCVGTLTKAVDIYKTTVTAEKGDEAYKKKDFSTALGEYKTAAQTGDAYCQFMVAYMYLAGEGTKKDTKLYGYWIRKSADNDFPEANYLVGIELLSTDPDSAVRYLEKAAAKEHGSSMHMLGLAYARGIGVQQNGTEALRWFRMAHAQGIPVESELLSESGIQGYMKQGRRPARPPAGSESGTRQHLVREIQQRLTDLGYDPGPVDGMFGGKTKVAIQGFQRKKGMNPDGQATPQVLEALKN